MRPAPIGSLAQSSFFEDVAPLYGDRIFAFDHFSISRTPEENVEMLLSGLPDKTFTFDVITHSRGGLVLRNLVERPAAFGASASRFTLGRAVLVAAPNEGTPLATPSRWEDTVGWVANLLEMFPENPFTTGAEFVANGLVWIAQHASGDLPGLHSMDGDGDLIRELQSPPGPPADRYSVLAANYSPTRQRAPAAARHRHRSVLQHGQRSRRPVGRRMAGRSVGRDVHPRHAHRLLRARRQHLDATTSRTSTSSRSRRRCRFSSRR